MAPYFFKPIDIQSKSVQVCPEITFLSHLETTVVLTGFDGSGKCRCDAVGMNYWPVL